MVPKHLCRGKGINTGGDWIHGYLIIVGSDYFIADATLIELDDEGDCIIAPDVWYEVDPKTVGRCTGYLDSSKDEVLMYEGDIVRTKGLYDDVLIFSNGSFGTSGGDSGLSFGYQIKQHPGWEVIGNVHDGYYPGYTPFGTLVEEYLKYGMN